ncbi:MAG: 2-nitropropane dioxygenase [Frankiales bacterium]|nr:2-nitropropane dioxygenase [Frankiales bacterium]
MNRAIVAAPMSGGPSTPALAAAVSNAGGLGFLAAGYRTVEQLAADLAETRRLTSQPFGVNVFAHRSEPVDVAAFARSAGLEPADARWSDDGYDAKLALLAEDPPAVVSFTFGLPEPLPSLPSEIWVTVTGVGEARAAVAAGADALVVQGFEAGGHRGAWVDRQGREDIGTLALLALVGAAVDLPLIATGGIADGAGIAAVLSAGAAAAMLGTAFLLCPEAATVPAHREAIATERPTALTRAFTGRLARGIDNAWMRAHADAPVGYPEIHYLTARLRAAARAAGDADRFNLWAGQAHALARALPAAELVRLLADQTRAALDTARARSDSTLPAPAIRRVDR